MMNAAASAYTQFPIVPGMSPPACGSVMMNRSTSTSSGAMASAAHHDAMNCVDALLVYGNAQPSASSGEMAAPNRM